MNENARAVRQLTLLYNADAGKLNAFLDSARKLFGVGACSLCDLTHGLAGERDAWRECRESLGVPISSLHRDELTPELESLVGGRLPAVVAETEEGPVLLMTPQVIDQCSDVQSFEERLWKEAEAAGLSPLADADPVVP